MKIKRPYSILLQMLLMLGLLFVWGVFSVDDGLMATSSLSCEEVDECIEEVEEDVRGHLIPVALCCPAIFQVEVAGLQFSCTHEASVAACAASHPSGWMMPLRI
jgi:hypothetical protein